MPSANASPAIRAVWLIVNPRSGRGRAGRIAARLVDHVGAAGFEVRRIDLGTPEAARLTAAENAENASSGGRLAPDGAAAVVVGGDGTMHSLAGLLARTGTPVYHVPTGTENLFARQFGMRAAPAAVVRALRSGRTTMVDIAECAPIPPDAVAPSDPLAGAPPPTADERPPGAAAPRPFLIVGSVGFDAGVIHRLAAARRGAISRASYLGPIASELFTHRAPALSITVDGRQLVREARGLALVANSRQYALRLDPAHRADMHDGLLDVVFFPARRLAALTGWAVLARLRLHHGRAGFVAARGRDVRINAADGRAVLQLDGEAVGDQESMQGAWRFDVRPGALRVLA